MTKVYEREYWEASLGAAIGHMTAVMLIYYWVNDAWTDWLVMPDFLFVTALKCVVTAMVSCNFIVCIGKLIEAGEVALVKDE